MTLKNISQYTIILASNSPRRKELLQSLGFAFEIRTINDVDESYPEGLSERNIPLFISKKKAEAYKTTMTDTELLITADTIVCLEGLVMGKPKSDAEAYQMLHTLSGKTHHVVTGVTITTCNKQKAFSVTSSVTFAQLTDEEINYYISTYKPFDKAGAYGIQEWIGYIGVEELQGSFFNVMGLPVQRLYKELKTF